MWREIPAVQSHRKQEEDFSPLSSAVSPGTVVSCAVHLDNCWVWMGLCGHPPPGGGGSAERPGVLSTCSPLAPRGKPGTSTQQTSGKCLSTRPGMWVCSAPPGEGSPASGFWSQLFPGWFSAGPLMGDPLHASHSRVCLLAPEVQTPDLAHGVGTL